MGVNSFPLPWSHSPWHSALVLAPPLLVDHPLASDPCPDKKTIISCFPGRMRLSPELLRCMGLATLEYLHSIQPQSSPWETWDLAPSLLPSLRQCFQTLQTSVSIWEVLVSKQLCGEFCLVFLASAAVFPSEVLKLPPSLPMRRFPSMWKLFLLHSSLPKVQFLVPIPLSPFFLVSFALLNSVWALMPVFRRCSVGVVPHEGVFLMHV